MAATSNYQYWYDTTGYAYIHLRCLNWFGVDLTAAERIEVLEMLNYYPAPTQDEAIETVLTIFLNK